MLQKKRLGKPPFGYDFTNDGHVIPLEDDLEVLSMIGDLIKRGECSLREGADYISHVSSRPISHQGLKLRLARGIELEFEDDKEEAPTPNP